MEKTLNQKRIGIDAIVLALYFALTPIHQTLRLSNGSTVIRYFALVVMIVVVLISLVRGAKHVINLELFRFLLIIALWFSIGIIHTQDRNGTVSALISLFSYFAFMVIVCAKEWTNAEKHLFKISLIVACVIYSVLLIQSIATARRATIIAGEEEIEADQNILAINIGLGFLFALSYFLALKGIFLRLVALASILLMLAGVVCTGSRGALIAIAIAAVYYLFAYGNISRRGKFWIIVIAVAILVGLIVLIGTDILGNEYVTSRYSTDYEGDFFSGRLNVWNNYIEMLFNRPYGFLVGYGYGATGSAYGSFFNTNWPPATHQDIIQIICCGGIPALVLFTMFVVKIWKKGTLNKDALGKACTLLVLIGGLSVDSFQRYGWWNAMIFAYIGIGALSTYDKR